MEDAGSAASPAAAAALLWKAAGDAMAWKASIREHAARTERRKAWETKAEADDVMRRMAAACGRAADAQGRMDPEVLWQVAAAMREAGEILARASKSFTLASELHEKAGAGQKRASKACKLAADPARTADMQKWAASSYVHARTAANRAAEALGGAGKFAQHARRSEDAARRASADGGLRVDDMGALSSIQAEVWESARQERIESAAMKERTGEEERVAAEARRLSAEIARQSAASAARVAAEYGRDDPGVERAVSAWRKAVSAANRVDAGGRMNVPGH